MQNLGPPDCTLHFLEHAACKSGSREEYARMSLSSGGSPSTLAVPPRGKETRLAAKARRPSGGKGRNAGTAGGNRSGPREARQKPDKGGSFSASAATELGSVDDKLASRGLSKLWVSVRSVALRASAGAAPAVQLADLRGLHQQSMGRPVVTTASCAPPRAQNRQQ